MKVVWALLLLFLSQADTYLGRREPHRGRALGLKSRQETSGTYVILTLVPWQAESP